MSYGSRGVSFNDFEFSCNLQAVVSDEELIYY